MTTTCSVAEKYAALGTMPDLRGRQNKGTEPCCSRHLGVDIRQKMKWSIEFCMCQQVMDTILAYVLFMLEDEESKERGLSQASFAYHCCMADDNNLQSNMTYCRDLEDPPWTPYRLGPQRRGPQT